MWSRSSSFLCRREWSWGKRKNEWLSVHFTPLFIHIFLWTTCIILKLIQIPDKDRVSPFCGFSVVYVHACHHFWVIRPKSVMVMYTSVLFTWMALSLSVGGCLKRCSSSLLLCDLSQYLSLFQKKPVQTVLRQSSVTQIYSYVSLFISLWHEWLNVAKGFNISFHFHSTQRRRTHSNLLWHQKLDTFAIYLQHVAMETTQDHSTPICKQEWRPKKRSILWLLWVPAVT